MKATGESPAIIRRRVKPIVRGTQRAVGRVLPVVRRAWAMDSRPEYRSWLGWPLLGLLLLIPGLALPWYAIALQPGRSAWSLPVVLAGMPSASWVSYGAVLAACLCLGLLAMARSRGRAGAATAAVGAAVLVVSLTFLVAAGTANWPLLQLLQDQAAQQAVIFGQFGYAVPGQAPSLMLLVPVTGSWALVTGALRLGWFCAAAGGLVLLGSGAPRLAGQARRFRRRVLLLPALALLILLATLARGILADYLAGQGAAALQSGDYQAASATLAQARQLNPQLASSTAYELSLGQVLAATSGSSQPLGMLTDAAARGAMGDALGQVTELRQAVLLDPANPVLQQQLDQASQVLAVTEQNPGPLQALSHPTVADLYTEGRIDYARADYPAAMTCFRAVLTMTGDGNVISSAYTYLALSELKQGHASQARLDLLRAASADVGYNNTLARSLLAGLYISTKSGGA